MATFWDYLGIGNSEADAAHDKAAAAKELNAKQLEDMSRSLSADRQYYETIANKDEREQALADVEALANRQEKRVKRSMVNTGNSAAAQIAAAKAAANTRDESYAGALQQSRGRKDQAKEKSVGLKQQQAQMGMQAANMMGEAAKERAEKMTTGQRVNALTDRMLQLGMTAASVYGAGKNSGWWGNGKENSGTAAQGSGTTAAQTTTIDRYHNKE